MCFMTDVSHSFIFDLSQHNALSYHLTIYHVLDGDDYKNNNNNKYNCSNNVINSIDNKITTTTNVFKEH